MKYKVCIPTAGLGSRLMESTEYINKSLVTLTNKPIISYIVEKFPAEVELVIALGYKGETVKEFLTLAYPEKKFKFVWIDKYEGPGSGLGYTLLKCREFLDCPFIFCSCDTIVTQEIPLPVENWMAYSETEDNSAYRSVRITDGVVSEVCSKGAKGDVKPYIGLAGIYTHEDFWKHMESGLNEGSIEIGESYALRKLTDTRIRPIHFDWLDTGNPESLAHARKALMSKDDPNILDKPKEAIWFVDGSVIKFSLDEKSIDQRCQRSEILKDYVPKITAHTKNFFKYQKVPGVVMSSVANLKIFKDFLKWIEPLWTPRKLSPTEEKEYAKICKSFYQDKTYDRVKAYYQVFEQTDAVEMINGQRVPTLKTIFEHLDWDKICKGVPSGFHGDLHFENILYDEKKSKFTLLDWRGDFGESLLYGDAYYDLAKLYHGLIISHELITHNQFDVAVKGKNIVNFNFNRKASLVEIDEAFQEYITKKGYDLKKVKMLTALIFLNIAALHHYPYCQLLYFLGKYSLFKESGLSERVD
jgi:NDP-sugar pyrophosphorylase family protein